MLSLTLFPGMAIPVLILHFDDFNFQILIDLTVI